MMSFTMEEQCPGFKELVGERDSRFGVSAEQKKEKRGYIEEPEIHGDADSMWKDLKPERQPSRPTEDQEPLITGTLNHFLAPNY